MTVQYVLYIFVAQDEYTTAAYKTVELDMFLQDAAIQHREVEGHESDLFKSYFQSITCARPNTHLPSCAARSALFCPERTGLIDSLHCFGRVE